MLITQIVQTPGASIVTWLTGIGGFVSGSASSLVFLNADGTYTHLIGSGLSFDAFSQTLSGSVTQLTRAILAAPNGSGSLGGMAELTFSVPVVLSVMPLASMQDFLTQLMNVPGNTNAGVGTTGGETFVGSNQLDSFDGRNEVSGVDVVDYRFATLAVGVDLSGGIANTGAAAGDVLTGIEGVRGTGLADVLRGSVGRNLLDGAGGNDTVFAGDGVDTLIGGDGVDRLDLTGLAGNLTVNPGFVGAAQFSGFESFVTGAGNDVIQGQGGSVEYITGGGDDTLNLSGGGFKTVQTGAGSDSIDVFAADGMAVDMGGDRDSLDFIVSTGAITTITMTDIGTGTLSGVFTGTISGVEVISSGAMRLEYHGHAGMDEVWASLGDDSVWGAAGDDLIHAGNGDDLLYGDSDWGFQGGALDYGWDQVWADGGNDTMVGSQGLDIYWGGAGTDVLSYAQLFDDFGNGTWFIILNANSTVTKSFRDIFGDVTSETDTIVQTAFDATEVIIGTSADDTFNTSAAIARTLEGGAGADLYLISAANGGDTVRGLGNGADVIRVSAGAQATATLAGNYTATSASQNFGTLIFDVMGFDLDASGLGGTQGVTIRNTAANQATMTGTAFADIFESANAQDVIYGGEGDDTYICTGGNIGLIFENGTSTGDTLIVDASVFLGSTIENVTLTGTAISAQGNASANRMIGNDMGNIFVGVGGADTMQGGLGGDTYTYTGTETLIEAAYQAPFFDPDLGWIIDLDRDRIITRVSLVMSDTGFEDLTLDTGAVNGTGNLQNNGIIGNTVGNALRGLAGDDSLNGGAGGDGLWGGVDNDRLRGDGGGDTLRGEAGNDTLLGGDGADTLLGGAGINKLTGGRGADQFTFGKVSEVTTVTDFTDGVDTLAFAGATGVTAAYIKAHAVQMGADVLLSTLVPGMEILVQNTTIAALNGDILIL